MESIDTSRILYSFHKIFSQLSTFLFCSKLSFFLLTNAHNDRFLSKRISTKLRQMSAHFWFYFYKVSKFSCGNKKLKIKVSTLNFRLSYYLNEIINKSFVNFQEKKKKTNRWKRFIMIWTSIIFDTFTAWFDENLSVVSKNRKLTIEMREIALSLKRI